MRIASIEQTLPTKDGWKFLKNATKKGANKADLIAKHLTTEAFSEKFYASKRGEELLTRVNNPRREGAEDMKTSARTRYHNSTLACLRLLVRRELTLWWRDRSQIKARLFQCFMMGVVMGTVFFRSSNKPENIISVLFQATLFSVAGAMATTSRQFSSRAIFYKHQDANFFPAWTFVVARSIASIPSACMDGLIYGTFVYFLVDLSSSDGANILSYFTFVAMMIAVSLTAGLYFSIFSASVQTLTVAHVSGQAL